MLGGHCPDPGQETLGSALTAADIHWLRDHKPPMHDPTLIFPIFNLLPARFGKNEAERLELRPLALAGLERRGGSETNQALRTSAKN
jgi:hypothetical protein